MKNKLVLVAVVAIVGAWQWHQRGQRAAAESMTASAPTPAPTLAQMTGERDPPQTFHCDGRQYCREMKSCVEAEFFLRNCPGVKMDGDNDGIPCEDQWCRHER